VRDHKVLIDGVGSKFDIPLVHDAPDKMRHAPPQRRPQRRAIPKTRKPKRFQVQYPGHCVALDTVSASAASSNTLRYKTPLNITPSAKGTGLIQTT
jgi:hypothetical protein